MKPEVCALGFIVKNTLNISMLCNCISLLTSNETRFFTLVSVNWSWLIAKKTRSGSLRVFCFLSLTERCFMPLPHLGAKILDFVMPNPFLHLTSSANHHYLNSPKTLRRRSACQFKATAILCLMTDIQICLHLNQAVKVASLVWV